MQCCCDGNCGLLMVVLCDGGSVCSHWWADAASCSCTRTGRSVSGRHVAT